MLQYNDHSVCVWVDDNELEEYNTQTFVDENKVVCWIASESGKQFKVGWDHAGNTSATEGCLQLDGGDASCGHRRASDHDTFIYDGFPISETLDSPFVFAEMQTTDDDTYLELDAQNGLGEIIFTIWKIKFTKKKKKIQWFEVEQQKPVHEKFKKAGLHCIKFGEVIAAPPSNSYCNAYRYLGNGPIATFVFKYCDRELLKAKGIIPSSDPLKRKVDAIDVDDEEQPEIRAVAKAEDLENAIVSNEDEDQIIGAMGALQQKLMALRAKKAKENATKRAKVEDLQVAGGTSNQCPTQTFVVPKGEVIDLTGSL
ncbi:hypothetical protein BJ138DRAFT_1116547 [Hygrophoropsis aurantiaca]|uniref:Uncharacterized protein n=1 Tax=Hygrophoropsis aurantiaca TaxID=72124 RepID=A0ACB8A3J0_9AGAM|nr:hypothetical protein BJ138DRAFT_1116547 [Hygrophoropsis aurantiaca]